MIMKKGSDYLKDRMKKIRKDAGLTLDKFGERIGMKKSSVSQIENGRNNPSDSSIKMICREFGVDEYWLRTGEGKPYKELSKKEKIAEFMGDVLNDEEESFRVKIIELMAHFTEDDWIYMADMVTRAVNELKKS